MKKKPAPLSPISLIPRIWSCAPCSNTCDETANNLTFFVVKFQNILNKLIIKLAGNSVLFFCFNDKLYSFDIFAKEIVC